MKKVILLRYGEIYLKGKNKGYFERVLLSNIKNKLSEFNCVVKKIEGRYVVSDFDEMDTIAIIEKLKTVFGLVSLSVASDIKTTPQDIENEVAKIRLDNIKFRVSVKRADKTFPVKSNEYERHLGGILLKHNHNICVSLKQYDVEVLVDIRENGHTYISFEKVDCAGGMPLGTAGKGLLLLSGGIDSPVAGYMMSKRGVELHAVHFFSFPYTSEQAKQKVIDLAKLMTNYCGKIKLHCCPFTEIQEEIHKNCSPEFMITIMRRVMMKIAAKICENNNLGCIITGENLAQVASQTMESLHSTNDSQHEYTIFRPLIAFDKKDIIKIAQKINTYETSILPYEDCCTVFLPENPVIKPKIKKVRIEESKLPNEDILIQNAIDKIEIVEC